MKALTARYYPGNYPGMDTNFPLYWDFAASTYCNDMYPNATSPYPITKLTCQGHTPSASCPKINDTIITEIVWNRDTDAAGWVGYNHRLQEIIVAYRGTASKKNWKEDATATSIKDIISGITHGTDPFAESVHFAPAMMPSNSCILTVYRRRQGA
jgi:hypothetical protein